MDETLFFIACSGGHAHLLDILYDAGLATIEFRNYDGETPLHAACSAMKMGVVRWLIDKGADIHAGDVSGRTALHLSAMRSEDITTLLLEKRADPNAQDSDGQTPLHVACRAGELEITETLLQKGADSNLRDNEGRSSVHHACDPGLQRTSLALHEKGVTTGKKDLLYMLEIYGADIDSKTKQGTTPLHLVCTVGDSELTNWFISKETDKDAKDIKGLTPLHMACQGNHGEVVETLLAAGVVVNARDSDGNTPFSLACRNDNTRILDMLVEAGADTDTRSDYGATPLHYACVHGRTRVFHWLVDRGADIEAQDYYDWTPLHTACVTRSVGLVKTLLEKGASVNVRNKEGATPFHIACVPRRTDVAAANGDLLDVLKQFGADIDTRSTDGTTPLHAACHEGTTQTVLWLLDRGADVNARDREGWTPLHHGCWRDTGYIFQHAGGIETDAKSRLSAMRALLDAGAQVDARNNDGVTPLWIACLCQQESGIRVTLALLEAHVDVNAATSSGTTALHVACTEGKADIVGKLLKLGADANVKDMHGDTPLICACKNGNKRIAKLLLDHGADITASNNDGNTALHFASYNNVAKLIEILLENGGNVDQGEHGGDASLHLPQNMGRPAVDDDVTDTGYRQGSEGTDNDNITGTAYMVSRADTDDDVRHTGYTQGRADTEDYGTGYTWGSKDATYNADARLSTHRHTGNTGAASLIVNKANSKGDTPLHIGCANDNFYAVGLLLRSGADPDIANNSGNTPLHEACVHGHNVAILIVQGGCNINATNKEGNTALHEACVIGHSDVVSLLLAGGAATNVTNKDGKTPLEIAREKSHDYIVEILKDASRKTSKAGVPGNTDSARIQKLQPTRGETALTDGSPKVGGQLHGDSDIAREKKRKHNETDEENATTKKPREESASPPATTRGTDVDILTESGADLNTADISVYTFLNEACVRGDKETVTLIVERGCNINAINERGNTALHEACVTGDKDIVGTLLAGGAAVNIINKDGHIPAQIAKEHGHKDIERMLNLAMTSQFIFSSSCQISGGFSSHNGQLHGDSDVILIVPENALGPSDRVVIASAVCVDLKTVHEKLDLTEEECIVSPAVEFFMDAKQTVFQKPLKIYLPHFLPEIFTVENVNVYQFDRGDGSVIQKQTLRPVESEEELDKTEVDGSRGVFCMSKTSGILILSSHFSGVVCTYCSKLPPQLHLRLYGEYIQRDTRDVDLFLLMCDGRLKIRDFRKEIVDEDEEKKKIIHTTLSAVDNVSGIAVGAQLILGVEQEKWRERSDAEQSFTELQIMELEDIRPCCPECDIQRFDWRIESKPGSPHAQWFKGTVKVGYVDLAAVSPHAQYLDRPRSQLLRMTLRLVGEQRSSQTQTENVSPQTHEAHLTGSTVEQKRTIHSEPPDHTTVPPSRSISSTASRDDPDKQVISHNEVHVHIGNVDSSQIHSQGTTVMGSDNQVGNTRTEDRHDVHTHDSYNRQVPTGGHESQSPGGQT